MLLCSAGAPVHQLTRVVTCCRAEWSQQAVLLHRMEALLTRKLRGAIALPTGGVEFVNGSNGGKVKVHPFNVRRAAVALTQAADKLPEDRRQQMEDMIRAHRGLSLQQVREFTAAS